MNYDKKINHEEHEETEKKSEIFKTKKSGTEGKLKEKDKRQTTFWTRISRIKRYRVATGASEYVARGQ